MKMNVGVCKFSTTEVVRASKILGLYVLENTDAKQIFLANFVGENTWRIFAADRCVTINI